MCEDVTKTNQDERENRDEDQGGYPDSPEERKRFEERKVAEKIERKKRRPVEAILAHCHECLGHYIDGRQDCENRRCPLYAYMPFAKLEPDFGWTKYKSKNIGKQPEAYSIEAAERAAEHAKEIGFGRTSPVS
jgi:hypothetical protein